MIKFPELTLNQTLKAFKGALVEDLTTQPKEQTILYDFYGGVIDNGIDYFEQAEELFSRGKDNEREVQIRGTYERDKSSLPSVFITLPSEESGSANGIGFDRGFKSPEFNEDLGEISEFNSRSFNTTYDLIITSNSTLEVKLLYYTFRSLLISLIDEFELSGFQNLVISGGDLEPDAEVTPIVYRRVIRLNFMYTDDIRVFTKNKLISYLKIGEVKPKI